MLIATKPIDAALLDRELTEAAVPHHGLSVQYLGSEVELLTHNPDGTAIDLPPEAVPVVDAHVAPPVIGEFATAATVSAIVQTTDDVPKVVFSFPCELHRRYTASLTIDGVDAGNFVSKWMEGRFAWKRITGNAVMIGGGGIVVVGQLQDAAAAAWAPNAMPNGTAVEFTVKGAAGRTIDWKLQGTVDVYAPGGLEA